MSYDFNFIEDGYVAEKPYDFSFRLFLKFNILPDDTSNLISIDIDKDTFFDSGYLYITMKNHFIVVDMSNKTLRDMYTFNSKGRSGDTLDKEEILDSDILVTN